MFRHTLTLCSRHAIFWILLLLGCAGCSLFHSAPLPADHTAALAWVAVGKEYLAEGDVNGARQALEHARGFDNTPPALWHGLALCAQLEHNYPLAHTLYQRA